MLHELRTLLTVFHFQFKQTVQLCRNLTLNAQVDALRLQAKPPSQLEGFSAVPITMNNVQSLQKVTLAWESFCARCRATT